MRGPKNKTFTQLLCLKSLWQLHKLLLMLFIKNGNWKYTDPVYGQTTAALLRGTHKVNKQGWFHQGLERDSQWERKAGTQGGVEVDPSLEQGTKIHQGEKVIKPHIERDILRVRVKQDLCYLWRNSWIIITMRMRLMDTGHTVLWRLGCR